MEENGYFCYLVVTDQGGFGNVTCTYTLIVHTCTCRICTFMQIYTHTYTVCIWLYKAHVWRQGHRYSGLERCTAICGWRTYYIDTYTLIRPTQTCEQQTNSEEADTHNSELLVLKSSTFDRNFFAPPLLTEGTAPFLTHNNTHLLACNFSHTQTTRIHKHIHKQTHTC